MLVHTNCKMIGSFTIPTNITQEQYKNSSDENYDIIGTENLPL